MALVKQKLVDAFIAAETDGVKLTKDAEKKVKAKCEAIAAAIDEYIKSADILVEVYPGIPVSTAGTPAAQTGATTAPGQAAAKEIF
jgi:hypothetical protein